MRRARGVTLTVVALLASISIFVLTLTSASRSVATAETVLATPAPVGTPAPATTPAEAHAPSAAPVDPSVTLPASTPRARASVSSPRPAAPTTSAAPAAPAKTPAVLDASLGFDPSTDGFAFDNWAGDTPAGHVTVQMAVRMFGARSVCADGQDSPCVLLPGVQRVIDAVNAGMVNGRCEGMVAFAGLSTESGRKPGAMAFGEAQVDIAYWSLSQVMPRVAARARATQGLAPSAIVREISGLMQKGRSVTLTIEGEGFAHSLLPVAVRVEGTVARISVYDPNYSGQTKTVTVDMGSQDWSYADAVDESGARVGTAGHGAGRLGFVENSLRAGTEHVRFES